MSDQSHLLLRKIVQAVEEIQNQVIPRKLGSHQVQERKAESEGFFYLGSDEGFVQVKYLFKCTCTK